MSLLKTALPGAVRSIEEMFAIAHAMEHEAATRYAELAARVRAEGIAELADLFEQLAEEERSHERSVLEWSQQRSGTPPDPTTIRWELPETFDEEAAGELAVSRTASAYRILSMAVRNEERAFAFWSYVVAEAETPAIREAAEKMAREELEHVSMLRRARRQAYHAERALGRPDRRLSVDARLVEAAELERHLAARLDDLAARLTGDDVLHARELAAQARAMSDEAASVLSGTNGDQLGSLDATAAAERLVEDYLDVGDRSREEDIVLLAQSLAKRAILRLTWLRAHASDVPPKT